MVGYLRPMKTAFLAVTFSLAATPLLAGPVPFDGAWKVQRFSLFSGNEYGFNGKQLTVGSDGAVSITYRPLATADWSATSARWGWRVREGVPATDLAKKGGDDRNLSLYFVYLPQAEAERLKGAGIAKLLRSDAARVLVYVWGGNAKRGAVLASPYLGARGKTLILRPSGTGAYDESVDLAGDYARVFGGAPGALVGVAVSADSDDTESRIDGDISALTLN